MKRVITDKAPAAVGPYSQATISGNLVFVSGQLGISDKGIIEGDIVYQTTNAIKNLSEILSASGSDFSHVVKTTCFLSDIGDFARFNEVYSRYFTEKPARSLVESSSLPKGSLIEIDAIAEIEK